MIKEKTFWWGKVFEMRRPREQKRNNEWGPLELLLKSWVPTSESTQFIGQSDQYGLIKILDQSANDRLTKILDYQAQTGIEKVLEIGFLKIIYSIMPYLIHIKIIQIHI